MELSKGNKIFIRTVTHYYTGEVIDADSNSIHLKNAAWIADTGRFADALATGKLNEVEPYPGEGEVHVFTGAIVDICPWNHELPRKQK